MKRNAIIILLLCIFLGNTNLSAQYMTKQQAFEYEVMNIGRGDASLKEIKAKYNNAHMLQSGGRALTGIGLLLLPIWFLTEITSSVQSVSFSSQGGKSDSGKVIMGLGLVISGVGLFTWTMGSHDKNKIVDDYLDSKYGSQTEYSPYKGTLTSTSNGFSFKVFFLKS